MPHVTTELILNTFAFNFVLEELLVLDVWDMYLVYGLDYNLYLAFQPL